MTRLENFLGYAESHRATVCAGAAVLLGLIALVWFYQFVYESRFQELLKTSFVRVGVAVCMVVYLCLCAAGGGSFIYFQF